MALYWSAEIGSFYAAMRALGVDISAAAATVALATGYTPTRRTLPLAGSGIVAALLSLAMVWVGVPLRRAVAGVVAYHLICIALATLISAAIIRRLQSETIRPPNPGGLPVATFGGREASRGRRRSGQ
jgi:hypothetical protein